MNKYILILIATALLFSGCKENKNPDVIHFAVSAEYPPFEYEKNGVLKGFDIDLAYLIAQHLGKQAVFDNIQFSTILPALNSGQVDAAISTLTITKERKKNFDFTKPYYFEGIAAVFKKEHPIKKPSELKGKKIACQLGSTMEIWLKEQGNEYEVIALNNNNQAIEALKAGHVDVVMMDGAQSRLFSQKNPQLSYATIAKSEDGYGVALKKNSPLTAQIQKVLNTLKDEGIIEQLQNKWLGGNND